MTVHSLNQIEQPKPLRSAPSWSLVEPKRDWLGLAIMMFCALVITATMAVCWMAQHSPPDEYDRIRQACPGKSVDVWSRDGGTLLAIRCELPEPRS